MKSFRWTIISGVLLAGLIAFTYYDYKRSTVTEEQKKKDQLVVKLKQEEISRIELVTRVGSTTLEKNDGKWRLTAPLQDLADETTVESLLSSITSEKSMDTVVEGEADLTAFGLKDPVTRLRVAAADGRSQEIKIGSVKAYDSNLYAQSGDEKRVLLVGQSWDQHLTKLPKDFRDKHLYRDEGKPAAVKRIEIRQKGATQFAFVKEGEKWNLANRPAGDEYPLSQDAINTYLDQVKGLRATELTETDKKAAGEIAKLGLDKPVTEVRLYSEDKAPYFSLALGSPQRKENPNVPAVSSDLPLILNVYQTAADQLAKSESEFFDRKFPFGFSVADVANIKISTPELKAEFAKTGGKDADSWAVADKGLQKEADSPRLKDLIEKLSRMEAVRVLEPFRPESAPGFKRESRVVLSKATGEPVFELRWGEAVNEKSAAGKPEATYVKARTSLAKRVIGVPEASVKDLGLDRLFKEPPKKESAAK